MVEPISILASVHTLVTVSYKLGQSLVSIHRTYNQAPQILNSLSTECTVTNLALARIQQMLSMKPEIFASALDLEVDLTRCVELALTTWATTFSVLDAELAKIKTPARDMTIRGRVRYMFNVDTLVELSRQLRDLRSSVNFLLDSFQTYSPQVLF